MTIFTITSIHLNYLYQINDDNDNTNEDYIYSGDNVINDVNNDDIIY